MKTTHLILTGLFSVLLLNPIAGRADDIDIYSGLPVSSSLPNVLIVLDNAANFDASAPACSYTDTATAPTLSGKTGGIEQCALNNVLYSLGTNSDGTAKVNVGIMIYNASGFDTLFGCNSSATGGCLMVPLTAMTAAGKAAIMATIKSWSVTASTSMKSNNEADASTMQESWAYFAGKTGMSGTSYTSTAANTCQKNFVIFISNAFDNSGTPGDASQAPGTNLSSTVNANTALTSAEKTTFKSTITIPSGTYGTSSFSCSGSYSMPTHNDGSGLYADEWARYMYQTDLSTGATSPLDKNIITYAIGVLKAPTPGCKPDWPALLTSMAKYGGGKYFATSSYSDVANAILKILNEVQAVNSVFASSSLPVSVNAQGTFLNQIYMGMFRPDASGLPRWAGNLKQYQFGFDVTTQTLSLVDSQNPPQSAISSAGTGFISPNAVSFWTTKNTAVEPDLNGGFWINQPNGAGGGYDLPDGELVEKGGASQVLRLANLTNSNYSSLTLPAGPRNLYTWLGGSSNLTNSANSFAIGNTAITDTMLGTGPRTITSITSAATVQGLGTSPWYSTGSGSVSITALSKSSSTVTATVTPASDVATFLSVNAQIAIATGATKYDCNACVITAINTVAGTFTYSLSGGSGSPALPSTATLLSNYSYIYSPGQTTKPGDILTLSGCTSVAYTPLNGTTVTVVNFSYTDFVIFGTASPIPSSWDTGCRYTPNTATVTTSTAHGLATGTIVGITGATPAGYNGSWVATVTGSTTFTYQYTVAAPLANFSGAATLANNSTTREYLIRWVRGEDNYGDEASMCPPGTPAGTNNCPSTAVTIRPSVHGDVLHSRPTVIDYGGTTGVAIFYGSNDGVYHAINGNQTAAIGTTNPGGELWGFIPTEFFGGLKRQHDDSAVLLLPTTPPGIVPTPQKKDYFVDGSSSVYQKMNADGTTNTAYLYLAMRRGGRLIYALDVSTPANPQFLWKKSSLDTDFAELGQTWSQPKVAFVKGYANPVLIFGAGYDSAEDSEPPGTDTMGRGIFIVDALDGHMVWHAQPSCSGAVAPCQAVAAMTYSISSDITLMDRSGNDGYIDRLYAADTGGNIWRVDLEPTATHNTPNYWQVTKLAALGCDTGPCASGTTPRKFFYPADMVPTNQYDAVLVGSGDREHPLYTQQSYNVVNRFYMVKDPNTGNDGSSLTTPLNESNLVDITSTLAYDNSLNGYYLTLGTGEKVVNAPLTVAGYTYFGTNTPATPSSNSCSSNLGVAKGYQIQPLLGTTHYVIYDGGGLPPSPVAGSVDVKVNGVDMILPFCIGCGGSPGCVGSDCKTAIGGGKPPISVSTSRSRTYWYKESD